MLYADWTTCMMKAWQCEIHNLSLYTVIHPGSSLASIQHHHWRQPDVLFCVVLTSGWWWGNFGCIVDFESTSVLTSEIWLVSPVIINNFWRLIIKYSVKCRTQGKLDLQRVSVPMSQIHKNDVNCRGRGFFLIHETWCFHYFSMWYLQVVQVWPSDWPDRTAGARAAWC